MQVICRKCNYKANYKEFKAIQNPDGACDVECPNCGQISSCFEAGAIMKEGFDVAPGFGIVECPSCHYRGMSAIIALQQQMKYGKVSCDQCGSSSEIEQWASTAIDIGST